MADSTPELPALIRAVEAIGSQAALARLCSVSQPSVWGWLNKSKRIPAEFVLKVEDATGVSRHELRPDIYPIEDALPGSRPDKVPPAVSPPAAGGAGLAGARP